MNSTKILVVDDEPDIEILIRQKFTKQIKAKEMEFVFVSNGAEALKTLYQDEDIHIILTDINMPEMDGIMLLSHLPELHRIFKAVIISAYGDMSNIRKAMNRGASDFITKPIDFKDLEITIMNAMEQCLTLKKAMEAQETLFKLEKELTIANHIQQSIIPHQFNPFPRVHSFEIYGTMIPAAQVGGDFFDFLALDEDRLGFIIGDVSGKGVPAAIFMSMCRAIIRGTALKAHSPKECFLEANHLLCMDNEACMFVTAFYGVYHLSSGLIECVNAGHNPPILLRADGSQIKITPYHGIPLGIMLNDHYLNYQFTLHKDDCLILYTDGIIEARNAQQDDYGEKRFSQAINSWTPGPLPSLTTHLLNQLAQFTQGTQPFDDVALFCLKHLE